MDIYDMLMTLRKITKMGPIGYLRVKRANDKAEALTDLINKSDPTHCYSTDYTDAINLEFKIRLDILKYNLYEEWKRYISVEQDGFTLEQYAFRFIEEYKNNHSKKL